MAMKRKLLLGFPARARSRGFQGDYMTRTTAIKITNYNDPPTPSTSSTSISPAAMRTSTSRIPTCRAAMPKGVSPSLFSACGGRVGGQLSSTGRGGGV
jgi:hypothetical protein